MNATLLIGGYTGEAGAGKGIEAVSQVPDAALSNSGLATEAASPSYLARHPRLGVVYAVCEMTPEVRAFSVGGSEDEPAVSLAALGEAWPAASDVCHVAVDPNGEWIVTSSYGDGLVQLFTLDADGAIVAGFDGPAAIDYAAQEAGTEPRPSRAHAALVLPDGRIATTDLGHDLLRVWSVARESGDGSRYALSLEQELALPEGSGPRLLELHPSGHIYIVTEHSVELLIVAPDADGSTYALIGMLPVLSGGEAPAEGDTGAHISIDASAGRAYVSVRKRNTLHTFAIGADGSTLHPLAEISTGGNWPRHHLQHEGQLHVANQLSNTVATFELDEEGIPSVLLGELATGAPTCVLAL